MHALFFTQEGNISDGAFLIKREFALPWMIEEAATNSRYLLGGRPTEKDLWPQMELTQLKHAAIKKYKQQNFVCYVVCCTTDKSDNFMFSLEYLKFFSALPNASLWCCKGNIGCPTIIFVKNKQAGLLMPLKPYEVP